MCVCFVSFLRKWCDWFRWSSASQWLSPSRNDVVSVCFSSDWHLSKRCSSSCHAQLDNLDCITSEVSSFFGVETPIGFTVVFVHVQKTILQPILTKLVFLVILTMAHIDLHEIWSPTSYKPTVCLARRGPVWYPQTYRIRRCTSCKQLNLYIIHICQ